MASEEYRILIQDETSDTEAASEAGVSGTGSVQQEQKKTNSLLGDVAKFFGSMVGLTSAITFIIQALRRSKILGTFMDSLLTTLAAVIDLLLVPLIPIFIPLLKLLVSFIPTAAKVGQQISTFLQDPWGTLIQWLGGTESIFGKALQEVRTIWGSTGEEIGKIWADEGLSFWGKVAKTADLVWTNIEATASVIFTAIGNWWESSVAPKIDEFAKNLPDDWHNFITTASEEVENVFRGLGEIWGNEDSTVWQKIYESAALIFSSAGEIWKTFWSEGNPGHTLYESAMQKMSTWWAGIWSEGGAGLNAWEEVQRVIGSFWTNTIVPSAVSFWEDTLEPIVRNVFEILKVKIENIFISLWNDIRSIIASSMAVFMQSYIDFIVSKIGTPLAKLIGLQNLIDDFNSILSIVGQQTPLKEEPAFTGSNNIVYVNPQTAPDWYNKYESKPSITIENMNFEVENNMPTTETMTEEITVLVSQAVLEAQRRI